MSSCNTGHADSDASSSRGWQRQQRVDEDIVSTVSENTDSEEEAEADMSGPPEKKVRVSSSAVHVEFEEEKDKNGKWTSKCKHCRLKETIYSHKNSSCLLIHLEKKHPEIYKKCIEKDKKERDAKKDLISKVEVGKSSSGHKTALSSLFSNNNYLARSSSGPMDQFLRSKKSLPGWKQERINRKYAYWLGASGLPVSAITDYYNFKDFIAEALFPRWYKKVLKGLFKMLRNFL